MHSSQETVGVPSSRSESNPQRVCSTATISAKLGTDGTALACRNGRRRLREANVAKDRGVGACR